MQRRIFCTPKSENIAFRVLDQDQPALLNSFMLPVQDIDNDVSKCVTISENWRNKNCAFEFAECINFVI
jgi:hypothetical protein